MTHLRHQLDPVIHSPVRFAILAALMGVERAEFRFIRDTVEVSDSLLSQHVTTLEGAGYLRVTKRQAGRRTTTWLSLTQLGRDAFANHLSTLNRIAAGDASDPGRSTEAATGPPEESPITALPR